jgi:trimeric autotransporter adhesin
MLPAILALVSSSIGFAQSYTTKTFAGTDRLLDGHAANTVPLRFPWGMVQDAAGNVYFADNSDNRVRKVDPSGIITTIVGTGIAGYDGDGGKASAATLDSPQGIALDSKGNLYIADYNNNVIRKVVLSTGIITTVVGNGKLQFSGDGGPAIAAGIDPFDVAVDTAGNLYISDFLNNRIRKVSAVDQTITTLAGTGLAGDGAGPANQAALFGPNGVSVDGSGFVYFVDYYNNTVKKIDQVANKISVFAGTGDFGFGEPQFDGDGGLATKAYMVYPYNTAVEANGNILIDCIIELWRVTVADGKIHFVAGSDSLGFGGDGTLASTAKFAQMTQVGTGSNGDVLIADAGNYRIRRIHNNVVNTLVGTSILDNIPATSAFLNLPDGIIPDGKGGLYIADQGDNRVREVLQNGNIANFAGSGVGGSGAGQLHFPQGIAMDAQGAIYIADNYNDRVMKMIPGGGLTVVAGGNGTGYSGDGSFGPRAKLNGPSSVAVDAAGNVYIADEFNAVIRMVDTNQVITTIAGTGVPGFSGDNNPAKQAKVATHDITLFGGNLYLAEPATNRIRKIDLSTKIISTVVGIGTPGYSGDGGSPLSAQLEFPLSVAFDAAGAMYIADEGNSVVRRVSGSTITTIAGNQNVQFNSDFGTALGVAIDPIRVTVDSGGTIYVTDQLNDRIRVLQPQTATKLTISSGNNGSGPPGTSVNIVVKVTDAASLPVGGALVNFTVTGGTAALLAPSATTIGDGTATMQVTFGPTQGPVTINAASPGLTTVSFSLTVTAPPVITPVPTINAGGVTGAGLSVPSIQALSANGIGTVKGVNFGAGPKFLQVGNADLVNGNVPTKFQGICLEIGGVRAFIFGASDTQINFQTPALPISASTSVKVISGCDTSAPLSSAIVNVAIQTATPEFFYFAYNADGRNPIAATDSLTGAILVSSTLFPGAGFQPAHQSEYVTAYATGFGPTNPPVVPGTLGVGGQVTGAYSVTLGGKPLPAANILFVGQTPSSPGLFQLNIQIPADAPDGDLPLVLTIGSASSSPGAFITVQHVN